MVVPLRVKLHNYNYRLLSLSLKSLATRSEPVKVVLVQCDITKVQVDVIINAANFGLKRGGGVCGAIFAAASTGLDAECDTLNGCSTGDAVLTAPHGLRHLKAIVHAVGPQVVGRLTDVHRQQLASCYGRGLELAAQHGLASIVSKTEFTSTWFFYLVPVGGKIDF